MIGFISRRIVRLLIQVFIVTTLIFILFRLVPGDPVIMLIGPNATQAQIEAARSALGLNQPIITQYFHYLGRILHGDLGVSLTYNKPVTTIIANRAWATIRLMLSSIVLSVVIGLPAGMVAGMKPKAVSSNLGLVLWVVLLAIPNFWVGLFLIQLIAGKLGWLPAVGYEGFQSLILPTLAIAARLIALVARITRSSMMEILSQDYVRTARAKGLKSGIVLMKHALKPALVPIVTLIGMQAGYLLGGSVVIENLFSYPGMGQLLLSATTQRDYALMQGVTIFFVASFLFINLLTDLSYGRIDPRIRYD
ncbi:ABC transporter permease [Alicyclobacillus curvatus]|jgi:ABC-type dipeptide/oligopeptide/nickel transport system permease component|nr:ABC transporter permease [Alicyclobacillus curvatus]